MYLVSAIKEAAQTFVLFRQIRKEVQLNCNSPLRNELLQVEQICFAWEGIVLELSRSIRREEYGGWTNELTALSDNCVLNELRIVQLLMYIEASRKVYLETQGGFVEMIDNDRILRHMQDRARRLREQLRRDEEDFENGLYHWQYVQLGQDPAFEVTLVPFTCLPIRKIRIRSPSRASEQRKVGWKSSSTHDYNDQSNVGGVLTESVLSQLPSAAFRPTDLEDHVVPAASTLSLADDNGEQQQPNLQLQLHLLITHDPLIRPSPPPQFYPPEQQQ
ncbi:unnamed protein product [Caenorhabditis auriculariae]|uniref:Uncharacterized protein n=1 Tax=Caenorhabditis auriculariae TaxID=2777116 RepID=A0A8S1HII4_9PELO|nr:unnamed protein product [Caenorhabditis auriculariae]